MNKEFIKPKYLHDRFIRSLRGVSGGQWGKGFYTGVEALVSFMERHNSMIEIDEDLTIPDDTEAPNYKDNSGNEYNDYKNSEINDMSHD